MDRDEELVDDSELCGKLSNDGLVFYRLRDNLDRHAEIDQLDVQEEWRRVDVKDGGHLGRGRFGEVFKEECMRDISGMQLGHFRAVKVIERGEVNTKVYYREELKALAKFSHAKVSALGISCKFSAHSHASVSLVLRQVFWLVRGHEYDLHHYGILSARRLATLPQPTVLGARN